MTTNVLSFTAERRTSRGNLLAGWLAGGTAEVYTEPRPATSGAAITTQTLLVTFDLPDPAVTVTDGMLEGAGIENAMNVATGDASWTRLRDSAGVVIGDADVGITGSGAFMQLSDLALDEGGYCAVLAFGMIER